MNYDVKFSLDADNDINEIYEYVAKNDSVIKAEKLIDKLIQKCSALDKFPKRGHKLPELEFMEGKEYLEIHYKPYRIIYNKIGKVVIVNCILDGRRNLNDILIKRILR